MNNEQIVVDNHTRGEWAKWLFEQAERGEVTLVTSAFTTVELNGGTGETSKLVLDDIAAIFDANYLVAANLTQEISLLARDLIWEIRRGAKKELPAKDAIHLASAIAGGCTKLITWDERHFIRLDSRFPTLSITTPNKVIGLHQVGLDISEATNDSAE